MKFIKLLLCSFFVVLSLSCFSQNVEAPPKIDLKKQAKVELSGEDWNKLFGYIEQLKFFAGKCNASYDAVTNLKDSVTVVQNKITVIIIPQLQENLPDSSGLKNRTKPKDIPPADKTKSQK